SFLLGACLFLFGTARGAAPPAWHADAEGMPLPEGALARIGSARLLHGIAIQELAVSADGRLVASIGNTDMNGKRPDVRIWDAGSGKEVARFEDPGLLFHLLKFSPRGDLYCFGQNG